MSRLMRLIPSRAAILGALAAILAGLFAWTRRAGRKDARRETELEDYKHADEITDRVSDSRADPDRLRPYEGAGWRD